MLSSRPVDFNNGGVFFPTKTPARGNRRLENQSVGGPMMSAKGGKMAGGMPKTPFHAGSNQKTILYTISRPLGDKTPAPNRLNPILFQTPVGGKTGGQKSKLSKLVLETDPGVAEGSEEQGGNTPPSSQRPSSQRKNIKQPKQLNLNGMVGKLDAFQTPMNKGNHWDVEDDELQGQGLMQEAILEDAVEEEDMSDGSIEFGHPNNLDLPYQPPFDFELPNFQVLGKTIRSLAFAPLIADSEKPVFADPEIMDNDLEWSSIGIKLDPLKSDDPFEEARNEGKAAASKPTIAPVKGRIPVSKATSIKPTPSLTSTKPRPTSSLARLPSQPVAKTQVTRVSSSSRPLQSSSATTTSSKAGTTTTRKVISKPAVPSSMTTTRPIARSTSTTTAGSAQPVVRQNLASMRRAQTSMSVRDAQVGAVVRAPSTVKVGSGVTKSTKPGTVTTIEGDLAGLNLNLDGAGLDEEFLFSVN